MFSADRLTGDYLTGAHRIAQRLTKSALWRGKHCTWQVTAYRGIVNGEHTYDATEAGPELYQGATGIGLFLAEVYRVTSDPVVRRTAEGALLHALDGAYATYTERAIGFFTGRLGVAYSLWRFANIAGEERFARAARALVASINFQDIDPQNPDLLSGMASAIVGLLLLSEMDDGGAYEGTAVSIGNALLNCASREVDGWSWKSTNPTIVRNVAGFSHGAAGCGYALAELFARVGDARFEHAAHSALEYADSCTTVDSDVADYRNIELTDYHTVTRRPELMARLHDGPPFRHAIGPAGATWCHGMPGMALARLRMATTLGDMRCAESAVGALTRTAHSLTSMPSFSLCHGVAGNAEALLIGGRLLDQPGWTDVACQTMSRGLQLFENRGHHWPSGTLDRRSDPGLFLGDAGIGYTLLRFADEQTPSIVQPHGCREPIHAVTSSEERETYRAQDVGHFFGNCAFRDLYAHRNPIRDAGPSDARSDVSAVELAYRSIRTAIAAEGDSAHRNAMREAFIPQRVAFLLARARVDLTLPYLTHLAANHAESVEWADATVQLVPWIRVVRTEFVWGDNQNCSSNAAAETRRASSYFLIDGRATQVVTRKLSPFVGVVLRAVRRKTTVSEAVDRVRIHLNGIENEAQLSAKVLAQLMAANNAGLCVANAERSLRGIAFRRGPGTRGVLRQAARNLNEFVAQ